MCFTHSGNCWWPFLPLFAEITLSRQNVGKGVAFLWAWDSIGSAFFGLLVGLWLLRILGGVYIFYVEALLHLFLVFIVLKIDTHAISPAHKSSSFQQKVGKGKKYSKIQHQKKNQGKTSEKPHKQEKKNSIAIGE